MNYYKLSSKKIYCLICSLGECSEEGEGIPNILGGGHVYFCLCLFILFKTGFNTIWWCLWGGGEGRWCRKIFVAKIGGVSILLMLTLCKFGTTPLFQRNSPLKLHVSCISQSLLEMLIPNYMCTIS